jgi:hypothetical protein
MLLSGTLADLDLPSIAAMTSLGRTSLRLELRESSGDLIGTMVLKAGRVVSATAGGVRGRDALRVIMRSASDTRFQLAHEPLDFAMSSALASVDELPHFARGTTGASPVPRLPTDEGDDRDGNDRDREGTLSLKPGSRPRAAPRARVAMMQGRLDEFDLLTLIQTIGVSRQLVEIEIRDRAGMTLGAVRIKSGKLVSARAGSATGVDAVAALSRAAEGVQFAAFRVAADPEQLGELASVAELGLRLNGAAPQPRGPSPSVESRSRRDRVVMQGALADFDLPTLLHTVGCSRQHCALEVGDEHAIHGTICVKSGIVVSATAGSLTGIPAVQHLIASPRSDRFRLIQLTGESPDQVPLGPVGHILLHVNAPAPAPRPPAPAPRPSTSTGGTAPSAVDRAPTTRAEGLPVMEGRLSDFDVRTVLEVLAATRQHARLQIFDPGQPPLGDVTVKAGWILSSQAGALRGKQALTFLLGASPRLQFRVLTLAEGVSAPALLGPVQEVLGGLPGPRRALPEKSTRILRWAIPISFALGGTIVFLVTRGGTTTRGVAPSDTPAAQHAPPPPAEAAAPKPAEPAPAATPPAPLAPSPAPPAASAPTEAPAQPPGAAAPTAAPSPPTASAPPSEAPSPPAASAPSEPPPAPANESPAPAEPSDDASPPAPADSPSGRSVKAAQAAMKQLGYDPGPVDGFFGRQTRNAILRFQRSQHLRATGALDPETWSAIVAQLMAHRSRP